MEKLLDTFPILQSKKFQTAFIAALFAFGGFALGFDVQQVTIVITPFGASILGQAAADFGKEREMVKAAFQMNGNGEKAHVDGE